MTPFVDDALHAFADAFIPLRTALGDVASLRLLLANFGWELDPALDGAGFDVVKQIFAAEIALLDTLEEADESARAVAIPALVVSLLRTRMPDPSWPTPLNTDPFWSGAAGEPSFPHELLDSLFWDALADHAGTGFGLLRFAGVFREEAQSDIPASEQVPARSAYVRRVVDWDQLIALIADPAVAFKGVYHWNGVGGPFRATEFLSAIADLFADLPVTAAVVESSDAIYNYYYDQTAVTSPAVLHQLTIAPFPLQQTAGSMLGTGRITLNAVPIPPFGTRTGDPVGFSLFPLITGQVGTRMEFAEGVILTLNGDYAVVPLIAEIQPDGVIVDLPLGALTSLAAEARVDAQAITSPWKLLGSTNGTRLELSQAHLALTAHGPPTDVAFGIDVGIDRAALVIAFSEGDSFLQSGFGSAAQKANLSLIVGWSNRDGFHIQGQRTLALTIPVNQRLLGAITIDTVTIALGTNASGRIVLTVAISAGFSLGPMVVVVDRMGLECRIKPLSDGSGNLGLIDLDLGFKPPNGVGLAVNAAIVNGGGFLEFNKDEQFYAGVLQLSFKGLPLASITAIGLLNTRLPDGKKGYSLLIILNATFDPGIELFLALTLNGVGGLFGLNRIVKLDRLQQGIKTNTLDSILFPADPIANAPRIISDLQAVFPPAEGRFVFGPILKLGWGRPKSFVIAEVGLILEVPSPVRLAILGILKIVLPDESVDKALRVVDIKVNFLGTIDFAKKHLAFDATLYQSSFYTLPISGDMALRANWGDNSNFILSVGGFHPAYTPPADTPQLKRITLDLLHGDGLRLQGQAYFAITSNTIQFGEQAELYVGVGDLNLYGFIGYDVLFQLNPFYFIGRIDAGLALRAGTATIMSIHVTGEISGPTPWHVRGKGEFKILFVTFEYPFNITFGEQHDMSLPDVDVQGKVVAALQDKVNWQGSNPPQLNGLVVMRQSETAAGIVLIQPFGALSIKQNVLPLEMTIDRFGAAKITGTNKFSVTQVTCNGAALDIESAREQFAPAQFKNMKDAEKLSAPSFEQLPAGVQATNLLKLDYVVTREVEYEEVIIDKEGDGHPPPRKKSKIIYEHFVSFLKGNVMARSPLSVTRKPDSPLASPKVAMNGEDYAVVNTSDLKLVHDQTIAPSFTAPSFAEARSKMNEMLMAHPDLAGSIQVVPSYEVIQA